MSDETTQTSRIRDLSEIPIDGRFVELLWIVNDDKIDHSVKTRWGGNGQWVGGYTPTHWRYMTEVKEHK